MPVSGSRRAVFHRLVSKRYGTVWGWAVEGSDGLVGVYATETDAVRECMAAGFYPVFLPDAALTNMRTVYPRGYEDRTGCVKVWEDEGGGFWWKDPSWVSPEEDWRLFMKHASERGPYASEWEAAAAVRAEAAAWGLDWGG